MYTLLYRYAVVWLMTVRGNRVARRLMILCRRGGIPLIATAVVSASLLLAPPAHAAPSVSAFSVKPSTTEAGGHPNLVASVAFSPPTADIKELALHLPAGLTANANAAPFCSRRLLVAYLCPLSTKVGRVGLTVVAFGLEAEAVRNIHNIKPSGEERLRLGISLVGTVSRGGAALMLPVRARPEDNGLDIAVAGPPREVAGYQVNVKAVSFELRGTIRARVGGRVRRRALWTNPRGCSPANTVLEVTSREGPPNTVATVSTFTPTGCGAAGVAFVGARQGAARGA
jgi:hypothetical protein